MFDFGHIACSERTPIIDEQSMPMPVKLRSLATLIAILATGLALIGCSNTDEGESSSAYQAACAGPPLRNIDARNDALEYGYTINQRYNCIDKSSFVAVKEQRDQWAAANTPEAIAKRAVDREKKIADEEALTAARVASQGPTSRQPSTASAPLVRCTSADGQSSTLQRGQCAAGDSMTSVTANKPLMERSDSNRSLIKCTSRDGKNVSIQRGNCASPDDYQQTLGDR